MDKHPLEDLLMPVVEKLGYQLVRVLTIGAKNPTLKVMIDRLDGKDGNVDDCAKVSRALSDVLDEKDPIENQYSLEVSSPGIDRPLTKPEHFSRFVGYEAKVEMSVPVENRKRFKGKILAINPQNIVSFEMENVVYSLPFDEISKAKIVITDAVLAQFAAAQDDVDL